MRWRADIAASYNSYRCYYLKQHGGDKLIPLLLLNVKPTVDNSVLVNPLSSVVVGKNETLKSLINEEVLENLRLIDTTLNVTHQIILYEGLLYINPLFYIEDDVLFIVVIFTTRVPPKFKERIRLVTELLGYRVVTKLHYDLNCVTWSLRSENRLLADCVSMGNTIYRYDDYVKRIDESPVGMYL